MPRGWRAGGKNGGAMISRARLMKYSARLRTQAAVPPGTWGKAKNAAKAAGGIGTETVDWACGAALDKLGFATSGELAAFWDLVTPAEAKAWCANAVAAGRAMFVDVAGVDGKLRRIPH